MEKKSVQGITDLILATSRDLIVSFDPRRPWDEITLRQLNFIFWMWCSTSGCEIDCVQDDDLNLVEDAYLDQSTELEQSA